MEIPFCKNSSSFKIASFTRPETQSSKMTLSLSTPTSPSLSRIFSYVMWSPEKAATWSNKVYASRTEPVDSRATQYKASSSAWMPISFAASSRSFSTVSIGTKRKLNCWHLDFIVAGTFCSSVVAKMNTTYSGGSSIVFKSALKAEVESMWTSSIM